MRRLVEPEEEVVAEMKQEEMMREEEESPRRREEAREVKRERVSVFSNPSTTSLFYTGIFWFSVRML